MPKNAQITTEFHSCISHDSKIMPKILQARLQQYMNCELPNVQDGFRKGRAFSTGSWKKQEFQKNIYICFIDYAKAFDCVDHKKLWKILKEMGIPDFLTCFLRNLYAIQEATVRTGLGKTDWFQIGKGVCQAVYCNPAYLIYMQSTSCEMMDWIKHNLESRLPGEISITSDMQIIPHLLQKVKKNKRASWWK